MQAGRIQPKNINFVYGIFVFILCLSVPSNTLATIYFVDSSVAVCANYNPQTRTCETGTYQNYNTIAEGVGSATQPGDTVFVRSGTYNERITPSVSGTAGNFITYATYQGESVVMRGFNVSNKNYIRIIGFEITHDSTSYTAGVLMPNSNYIHIINNNIHHTYLQAIRNTNFTASANNAVVRGNTISYPGCPSGVSGQCVGAPAIDISGSYNLFEYNTIIHSGDYINANGNYNIIRNNYLSLYDDSDFPDRAAGGIHADFWQVGTSAVGVTGRGVFESNFVTDSRETNSHVWQFENFNTTHEEYILRGNVAIRLGSGSAFEGVDKVRIYNNTLVDTYYGTSINDSILYFTTEGGSYSNNNFVFNNIFYKSGGQAGRIMNANTGSDYTSSNNACVKAGSHVSCSVTSGLNFINEGADDYQLQATSKCINAGKAITIGTSTSGSGTSFTVSDANFFTAGFGIVTGDKIKVGNNNPVTITHISSNTITVDSSISWNNGDGVYWRNQDTFPDIGGFEYDASGYGYTISVTNVGSSVVAASVTNPSKVRFVIWYVDGIPVQTDTVSPYQYTYLGSSDAQITAVAYALYADSTPTKSASLGGEGFPQPPSALRIVP